VVLANSPHHVEFARQYNANVWEIPSVVDADAYTGWQPRAHEGPVRVGWSGSSTTVPNLQMIRQPLAHVAARDDVALQVIGVQDVCYLSLDAPLTHPQVVAYLSGLARGGHEIHLLTFEVQPLTAERRGQLSEQMTRAGITWHGLRYHKRPSLPATMYDTLLGA